jgi:hypothetical protein
MLQPPALTAAAVQPQHYLTCVLAAVSQQQQQQQYVQVMTCFCELWPQNAAKTFPNTVVICINRGQYQTQDVAPVVAF